MSVEHVDLDACCQRAMELAREVGAYIVYKRACGFDISIKEGVDLVTEVDKYSENVIMNGLRETFPSHEFIGEESTQLGTASEPLELGTTPTWIIDPLDGTTNYVTGQNDVVVSIALAISGAVVLGVVYNPFLKEMYHAIKGRPTHCNGLRISVGKNTQLAQAVVMSNIGASRSVEFATQATDRIKRLLLAGVRGVRCGGSAAMNMCYVASNRMSAFFEVGFGGPWDVAAGKIIVEQAGGRVMMPNMDDFVLLSGPGQVLCGNGDLCAAISTVITSD